RAPQGRAGPGRAHGARRSRRRGGGAWPRADVGDPARGPGCSGGRPRPRSRLAGHHRGRARRPLAATPLDPGRRPGARARDPRGGPRVSTVVMLPVIHARAAEAAALVSSQPTAASAGAAEEPLPAPLVLVRRARRSDLPAMMELLDRYARRGLLLPRTPEQVRRQLADF